MPRLDEISIIYLNNISSSNHPVLSLRRDYLRKELTEINHYDLLFYSLDRSTRIH